jgi:hypothetical protein
VAEYAARTPSHNIIAGAIVGLVGCALIALWQTPWLTLLVMGSAFLGFMVGLHVMAVRTGYWTEGDDDAQS